MDGVVLVGPHGGLESRDFKGHAPPLALSPVEPGALEGGATGLPATPLAPSQAAMPC